jgi:hypothetical protein
MQHQFARNVSDICHFLMCGHPQRPQWLTVTVAVAAIAGEAVRELPL